MKIVCVSDTHGKALTKAIPDGDVLVHAGDFTMLGRDEELERFDAWLGELPHRYKIVIPGNHDLCFESAPAQSLAFLTNADHVLIHEAVIVEGVHFFGSPWTPKFGNWAFGYRPQDAAAIWSKIPQDTDVLITHGPPYGILDRVPRGNVGCSTLLAAVDYIHPKLHVFGHIHEGAGYLRGEHTTFVNASVLDERYVVRSMPVTVVDI